MKIVNTLALYLLAGMSVELSILVDNINSNYGSFPMTGDYKYKGTVYKLQNGFFVENSDVGGITKVSKEKLAVEYTHRKGEKNNIFFISGMDKNTTVAFNVMSVPIHDHSTIVQGGPAYGTYYSDAEED